MRVASVNGRLESALGPLLFFWSIIGSVCAALAGVAPIWVTIAASTLMPLGFFLGMVPPIAQYIGQPWQDHVRRCGARFWVGVFIAMALTVTGICVSLYTIEWTALPTAYEVPIFLSLVALLLLKIQSLVFLLFLKMRRPKISTYTFLWPVARGLLHFGWLMLIQIAALVLGMMILIRITFPNGPGGAFTVGDEWFLVAMVTLIYVISLPFMVFSRWYSMGVRFDRKRAAY